ncbi:MAG: VOC family protein [Candidatus Kapaibacterium sp.]|jgi:predicted enzyme related to lactoylglutathione lyase
MNKKTLIALALATSFSFGFAFNSLTRNSSNDTPTIKRVTGIGGIFFKCKDPRKVNSWYKEHLGLNTNQYGAVFEWRQATDSTKKGFSSWSPFKETTKYFEPSTKDFMINYRVDNLGVLVGELKKEGVTIVDTIQAVEYGKFVHILDLEGNKIELWEPNDLEYAKIGVQMKSRTTK